MNLKVTYSLSIAFILLSYKLLKSQSDSSLTNQPFIHLSAFADIFYGFDFNEPSNGYRHTFVYNHNRHNQLSLNQAYAKIGIEHDRYRGALATHVGTYVTDNYAQESGLLKNIFEAQVGFSLNKKNTIWLDAGVFPSHIGFESAVSMENWTLTRSLLADNSPYFLTGLKITTSYRYKLEFAALICNGWQRIQWIYGNTIPSFGTQLKYTPTTNLTINWSTFAGTNDPDSFRRWRYFNNLYLQTYLNKRVGIISGFDFGIQQTSKKSSSYATWYSPVIIVRYCVSDKLRCSIRGELYSDAQQVIISNTHSNGFNTKGFSINADYEPLKNTCLRVEGRWLKSSENIFEKNNSLIKTNFFIIASFAFKLNPSE